LDADNFEKEGKLAEIRNQRGYNYSDCITCTPEKLPNYEQKVCLVIILLISVILFTLLLQSKLSKYTVVGDPSDVKFGAHSQ